MSSVVISGDTSGAITVSAPLVAGTNTLTLQAGTGTNSMNTLATAVASTSGTSIDFTSLPSWIKRITVMFSGVSTSGTSIIQVQLGDAGGIEATGYAGSYGGHSGASIGGDAYAGAGFVMTNAVTAASNIQGQLILSLVGSNVWVGTGNTARANNYSSWTAGTKTLSDTLTQVRITTVNGTDTFDAGTVNILYEG
jgi:hypothetical protein